MTAEELFVRWNSLPQGEAIAELLPCNGSRLWAQELVLRRPYATAPQLFAVADQLWWELPKEAWEEAFATHPRIGERHATTASKASLQWSAGEQSGVKEEAATQAALRQGNQSYEQRFGRVFLVCATGKSAEDMLQILKSRLLNEADAELREAAEQQRRITQLRLRKWLGLPAARCEDV